MSSTEPRPGPPDSEALVGRVIDIIAATRALPLSSSVKLDNKDEVLELLEEAVNRLPDELRNARWMLKEREEHLNKTHREGEEILESARLRAERMVQRTEIVREAHHTARKVVEDAQDEARRLRLEAEDYCDQKLASFEIVLERTIKTVAAGRLKLSLSPSPIVGSGDGIAGVDLDEDTLGGEDAFFDQDRG
ncbi:MAG: DivIVA domain-containing protein [Acidimicrobiales bacterium]